MKHEAKVLTDEPVRIVLDHSRAAILLYMDGKGYEQLDLVGIFEEAITIALHYKKTMKHVAVAVATLDTEYMVWGKN